MNLLIIEDEERVAAFLSRGLRAEGHSCEIAADGQTGLERAVAGGFDVIILDRMLPRRDGMAVLQGIKAKRPSQRVLMLTALNDTEDRVLGLRSGADDYLGKPFDFDELLARVEVLGRRDSPDVASGLLERHGLSLDQDGRHVSLDGEPLGLTQLEFDLLHLFMREPGRALSRERILSRVWGSAEDPLTNVVDVYIRRLRKKIDGTGPSLIQTVRGVGYRFRVD